MLVSKICLLFWLKSRSVRGVSHRPAFMGNYPTISHTLLALLPGGRVLLQGKRMWGQSKISSYCFCVWCKSRELGSRGSSRFPCVTPVLETFYSDRVVFRILTNINDGALLQKQSMALTRWLFLQSAPPQCSDRIPNADRTRGAVNVRCGLTASAWNS